MKFVKITRKDLEEGKWKVKPKPKTKAKPNARLLYKVGDVVEMNFGIKPQRIVGIPARDRVDIVEPESGNKKGIGVPLYWVKGKLKKKRTKRLPKR